MTKINEDDVLAFLRLNPATTSEVAAKFATTKPVATQALASLRTKGVVVAVSLRKGKGRGRPSTVYGAVVQGVAT